MNSHIQITSALLESFSHKTSDGLKVNYLDFKDFQIKEEKISILGTQKNFYSEAMENFLKKEVEGKVGDIFAVFRKLAKGKLSDCDLHSKDQVNIIRFFAYSLLRGNGVREIANKKSIYAPLFEDGYTTEMILQFPSCAINYFNNYFVNICTNKTNIDFIIPCSCIYSAKFLNSNYFWVLPISPKCCVLLMDKNDQNSTVANGGFIGNPDYIQHFNDRAFIGENTCSKNFIVGDISELSRVKNKLK